MPAVRAQQRPHAPRPRSRCRATAARSRRRERRPALHRTPVRGGPPARRTWRRKPDRLVSGFRWRDRRAPCHAPAAFRADSARRSRVRPRALWGPPPLGPTRSPRDHRRATSDIPIAMTRAGWARTARRPPLRRERCLRTRIDFTDRGARNEQRTRKRLLLGKGDAARRCDPVRGRAARDQHQDEIICPAESASASVSKVAARPAASGIGWPASTVRMRRVGRP